MTKNDFIGKRIATYARYSSDKQNPSSTEDQTERCVQLVTERGGVVPEVNRLGDDAVSGAKAHRPGLDRLMEMVRARQLDLVVVEDIDRLSRDLGNALAIFKEFAWNDVELLSASDGMSSRAPNAKTHMVMRGHMSESFLDNLRDKTFRGQLGRFRNGYATGAVPYGYATTPKKNLEGKVEAHIIHIDEQQAAMVRRIFRAYLEGQSLAVITSRLNAEGISPPRSKKRKGAPVWGDTTVRSVLHNEVYAGTWRFGVRQWGLNPKTEARQPRETLTREVPEPQVRPHLRIIDAQTWSAVEARLAAVRRHYVRTEEGSTKASIQGKTTDYLFSGLLVCDHCGDLMTIYGGSAGRRYRCSGNAKRGTCTNRLSVRESVVRDRLLPAISNALMTDHGLVYARKVAAQHLGDRGRVTEKELKTKRTELLKAEGRIKTLIEQMADGEAADYIREALNGFATTARKLKTEIEELENTSSAPVELPSPQKVRTYVENLQKYLGRNVLAGREYLRKLLKNQQVRLQAQPDGVYIARTELLPLVLLTTTPPREDPEEAPVSSRLCGGRI